MSFSSQVKDELVGHINPARHCQLAELAALLQFIGQYGLEETGGYRLGFQTENEAVARKGFTLLKKAYNIETDVALTQREFEALMAKFDVRGAGASPLLIKNSCCRRAFLRGAFLSVGSLSNPERGYHLEFVCSGKEQADLLRELMEGFDIYARIVLRKKYHIVYLKEGAGIVELLNVMEAHAALMELENLRILKEMRNSINRRVNCEAANITKTVNASSRQVEDIELLRDVYGLEKLPESLREMALVRLEYPEASLKELGGYLSSPVGKSGVNHRLRKLSELADRVRE